MLDVEKYSTQKNEEEIYKIELQKAELRLAATKKGTSEYAQALADKLQLERDYEKNVRALQSSKVVDDLTFNKQEIDNKIAVLQLEYDAHKISKSRMLQTEIEYINQKKNLELAALQEQLKMVEGNAAEEIKIKRNSQRIMEEYNLEANRKTLELWEHEHEAFKNVTSDITSGWGSTVSDLINGNLTFEGALNSMLDTVLNSFGNMCGQMVQTWLEEHLTMESVSRLFGIKKAAADQLVIASNSEIMGSNLLRMQSETALAGTAGMLDLQNGILAGANQAVALTAGEAATVQGVAAGEMAASSGVMGSAISAIIAPITALAGAMATLALSSGAVATNMAIIAVSTGLFTLEAALASLTATLLSASLGILAATSTIAAKAMATLAIANAANSAAMIPFVGWMIAPGAALSTGASIMAADSLVQFREKGGEVKKGQPYIVGEKRPELFIPDRNGRIEPNLNSLNGGGGDAGSTTYNNYSTNITVQAIDTKDFKQRVGELTPYIHQNLQSGIKKRQLASLGGKQ